MSKIINEVLGNLVSVELYDDGKIRFVDDGDCPEFKNIDDAQKWIDEYLLSGYHLDKCKNAYENDYRNNDAVEYLWHLMAEEAAENLALAQK